jgi:hypothetical protein
MAYSALTLKLDEIRQNKTEFDRKLQSDENIIAELAECTFVVARDEPYNSAFTYLRPIVEQRVCRYNANGQGMGNCATFIISLLHAH